MLIFMCDTGMTALIKIVVFRVVRYIFTSAIVHIVVMMNIIINFITVASAEFQ